MVALASVKIAYHSQNEKTQTSYSFLDKENREKYYHHTKRDIVEILENTISDKQPSYVIALEELPEEQKEIIKAHFFTAEKYSKKYKGLYSDFNKILAIENEFRNQSWKVQNFISKIEQNMLKIAEKNYSKEAHFDLINFNHALGFNFDLDLLRPEIMANVNHVLLIVDYNFKDEENKTTFFLNKIPIATANEHWTCVEFHDYLIKEMQKLKELVKEANFSAMYKIQGEAFKYSQLIKNNFQTIKNGIPTIGVCKSCLDYFPEKERKKMDKYLIQFHTKLSKP